MKYILLSTCYYVSWGTNIIHDSCGFPYCLILFRLFIFFFLFTSVGDNTFHVSQFLPTKDTIIMENIIAIFFRLVGFLSCNSERDIWKEKLNLILENLTLSNLHVFFFLGGQTFLCCSNSFCVWSGFLQCRHFGVTLVVGVLFLAEVDLPEW